MKGSAFYQFIGLLTSVWFSTSALAGSGYLARVGPKPLRFEEAAPRRDAPQVMAAPTMNEHSMTNHLATEEFGPQPLQPPVGPETMRKDELVMGPPEAPMAPTTPMQKPITTDTMLQFFNPGKHRDTFISVPVEFTPPAPAQTKSSTATYSTE